MGIGSVKIKNGYFWYVNYSTERKSSPVYQFFYLFNALIFFFKIIKVHQELLSQ